MYDFIKKGFETTFEASNPNIVNSFWYKNFKKTIDENIFRFSIGKNLALVAKTNELAKQYRSFELFKTEFAKLNNEFNKNWLKVEYEHSQAVGGAVANYRRQIENRDILPYLKWVQIERQTKRQAHASLNGMIWKVEDVPFIPPIGFNCGCQLDEIESLSKNERVSDPSEMETILKKANIDKNGNSEWDRIKKHGFDVNYYKQKVVFSNKMQYVAVNAIDTFIQENNLKP